MHLRSLVLGGAAAFVLPLLGGASINPIRSDKIAETPTSIYFQRALKKAGRTLEKTAPPHPVPGQEQAASLPSSDDPLWTEIDGLVGPPVNDNFAAATVIVTPAGDVPPISMGGDNVDATKETGEPSHGLNASGRTVWWKWTAPSYARVSLYSSNSDISTVVAVYTGIVVNALTPVTPAPYQEQIPEAFFFEASLGTTYLIAVDGVAGAAGPLQINLGALEIKPPIIAVQPASTTVTTGNDAILSVTVTGGAPSSYQWFLNNNPIDRGTSPSHYIFRANSTDAGSYHVVVSNIAGTVKSANAAVTVLPSPLPAISTQPLNRSLTVGETATFTVTANGNGPLRYQWSLNGALLPGATAESLSIPNVQAVNAGSYRVVVSNDAGSVTSDVAELRVFPVATRPIISSQPTNQTVLAGANVTFSVTASSYPDVSGYQWLFNGTPVVNATSATLQMSNVQTANAGSYSVNVTNPLGTTASSAARLDVTPVVVSPPASGGGGSGGGGAPSAWFSAALVTLLVLRGTGRYRASAKHCN